MPGDGAPDRRRDGLCGRRAGVRQTQYSRKVDSYFLSALSGIAQSAMKFANDLRIAQSFEELEEPFEKHQDRLLRHAV